MTPDRWTRISDLFDRVADAPPEARAALLDQETAGDAALREEVERMLTLDLDTDGFLDGPPAAATPAPPERAGPWRLVERVGVGGMGEVWRAQRADGAFEQTAAVKLVRPGLGDVLVARFRAERQILAGLDHPAIARLLDGGTASDGRPYLATEFVRGVPITAYCDRSRLTVSQRIALVEDVCRAVAYAHTRLVVHRDLKPSNVLVTDAGRVKLLDFGIAKLIDADDTLTQTGRPVLTPAYAAPEQAAGGPVTTATDVYGLGVLLYEILTGCRPDADGATRPSQARAAAGGIPPKLDRDATGALRSTTPDRLRRRLSGDLDHICLKALRADPERRYRGAAHLADDLRRHLDGIPIEARPESVSYRAGRFVRRHRAAVAALAALVVVTAGLSLAYAARVQAERDRAEQSADEAQALSRFLFSVIAEGDPQAPEARRVADIQGALRIAQRRLADGIDAPPAVRADLYAAFGFTSIRALQLDVAGPLLHSARSGYESLDAPPPFALENVLFRLADLHRNRGARDSAQVYYRRVIGYAERASRADGFQAWSLLWLATMAPTGAERDALFARAEAASRRAVGEPPMWWAVHRSRAMDAERRRAFRSVRLPIAFVHNTDLEPDAALPIIRRARRDAERYGFEDLAAYARFVEGMGLVRADPRAALPLVETGRRQTGDVLGRQHLRYAEMTSGLARVRLALGDADSAVRLADEALAQHRIAYGDHPTLSTATACFVAAEVRIAAGRPAADLLDQAAEMYDALVLPGDPRHLLARELRASTVR